MRSWKQIAENLIITEAQEAEYYIEDKLISMVMPTDGDTDEVTFFIGGSGDGDGDGPSADEKHRGTRLLVRILKLLQNKGYFGDVAKFLSGADVRRQLSNYGILHAKLLQPMKHRDLKRIISNAGLSVVSSDQYNQDAEPETPAEIEGHMNAQAQQDINPNTNNQSMPDDEDDEENKMKEEGMNFMHRMMYRQRLMKERPGIYPVRNKDVSFLISRALEIAEAMKQETTQSMGGGGYFEGSNDDNDAAELVDIIEELQKKMGM